MRLAPVGLDDLVVQRHAHATVRWQTMGSEVIVERGEVAQLRDVDEGVNVDGCAVPARAVAQQATPGRRGGVGEDALDGHLGGADAGRCRDSRDVFGLQHGASTEGGVLHVEDDLGVDDLGDDAPVARHADARA